MHDVHEVAKVDEPCRAGATHEVVYVDTFGRLGRQVHGAVRCPRCGEVSEADYADLPPNAKRKIMEIHGAWEAKVNADAKQSTVLTVRKVLGLDLNEARRHIRAGELSIHGTRAEVSRFLAELYASGVDVDETTMTRLS